MEWLATDIVFHSWASSKARTWPNTEIHHDFFPAQLTSHGKNKWDLPHNVIVVEVEVEGGWDLLHQPCPGLTQ